MDLFWWKKEKESRMSQGFWPETLERWNRRLCGVNRRDEQELSLGHVTSGRMVGRSDGHVD